MTCIEKFTFSRRFPTEAEFVRRADEPGPLLVMHGEEEIARIRAEAMAQGRAEGHAEGFAVGRAQAEAEAAAAAERHEARVLDRLAERLAETAAARDEIAATAERGALALAAAALRKALPAFHRRLAQAEIEALLAEVAERVAEPAKLTVAVHPDVAAALQTRLDTLAGRCRLTGRLRVTAAPEMVEGDCRISWAGGGAERQLVTLLARIEDIVRTVVGDEPDPAEIETSGSIEHHG